MHNLPLPQLREKFAAAGLDTAGPLTWVHFFEAPGQAAAETLAEALAERGFEAGIYEDPDGGDTFLVDAEEETEHTAETLFQTLANMRALAAAMPGCTYDGSDIDCDDFGDGDGCCGGGGCCGKDASGCGGDGDACDCDNADCRCDAKDAKNCGCDDGQCCGDNAGAMVDGDDAEDDADDDKADGDGCAACSCGAVRREGEPISNPALLAAVARLRDAQANGAAAPGEMEPLADALAAELQRGLYLVPLLRDALPEGALPDDKELNELDDLDELPVMACADEAGREFLPAFTDEAALRAWLPDAGPAMVLTAPELWAFALGQEECHGVVVDPAGVALSVDRDMAQTLLDWIEGAEDGAAGGE